MILRLPLDITKLPVYPKGREFSPFEALVDYLLAGPKDTTTPEDYAIRWQWTIERVAQFLAEAPVRDKSLYLNEETPTERKALAQEVMNIYNEVFGRRQQLDPSRLKAIYGRIKEGKHLKPPIGPAQFRAVFEYKKEEWTGTEHEKYLTIATLCAGKHFFEYLDAARLAYKKRVEQQKPKPEGVTVNGTVFKLG